MVLKFVLPLQSCAVAFFLCLISVAGSGYLATGNGGSEVKLVGIGFRTRHILQTEGPCPINMDTLNYTVVTSVCPAQSYDPPVCCRAMLKLACTAVDYINDETKDCASQFWSFLNLYGNYTAGSWRYCDTVVGLGCPPVPSPSTNQTSATMDVPGTLFIILLSLMSLVSSY